MKKNIPMSKKEIKQLELFSLLKAGKITQKAVAEKTGLSCRQVRRNFKRYLKY